MGFTEHPYCITLTIFENDLPSSKPSFTVHNYHWSWTAYGRTIYIYIRVTEMPTCADSKNKRVTNGSLVTHQTLPQQGGYFPHTINISNDQTLILDITGARRRRRKRRRRRRRNWRIQPHLSCRLDSQCRGDREEEEEEEEEEDDDDDDDDHWSLLSVYSLELFHLRYLQDFCMNVL